MLVERQRGYHGVFQVPPQYRDLTYDVYAGPKTRHEKGPDALDKKTNCQLFAHMVIEDLFGYALPWRMRSRELYSDYFSMFIDVGYFGKPVKGDIYLFGYREETDPKNLHVAVCYPMPNDPPDAQIPLLHATRIEGRVVRWPIDVFFEYDRYGRLFGIRRPIFDVCRLDK